MSDFEMFCLLPVIVLGAVVAITGLISAITDYRENHVK